MRKGWSEYSWAVKTMIELPNYILVGGLLNEIRFWNLKSSNSSNACTRVLSNKEDCFSIILISNEEMVYASDKNITIFRI